MTSPYLTAVSSTNFIPTGIGRDLENSPPIAFFGLLRSLLSLPLTLSLSFAFLLGLLSPSFSLSFSLDLSLGLALLRFISSALDLSLFFCLPPTFGGSCRANAG
jgi:hypothetical protein